MSVPISSKAAPKVAPTAGPATATQAGAAPEAGREQASEVQGQVSTQRDQLLSEQPIPPEQQVIEEFSGARLKAAQGESSPAADASAAGGELAEQLSKGIRKPAASGQQGTPPGDGKTPPPLHQLGRWLP
jgi:hypothetical protein